LTQINALIENAVWCGRGRPPLGAEGRRLAGRKAMEEAEFPTILARALMAATPSPLVELGAAALLGRMRADHPDLFRALDESRRTTIRFELTDSSRRFLLRFGEQRPSLRLARADDPPADACVKGSLDALLALLEGRIDGDALFFTRALVVEGDAAAIVMLRNLLDRETISVLDEAASLFGPLKGFVRGAALRWEGRAERLGGFIRAAAGAEDRPRANDAAAAENQALRAEIEALKTRLSKLEARRRREEGQPA
jgi:predicted lipid carrier protein YhbT